MLPLNNDVCGLIEKKLGENITINLQYIKKKVLIYNFTIKVNPYYYKIFEAKFNDMQEFKIINVTDLEEKIIGFYGLSKLLD
jgi:hypothetical protein